jgi:hypothetical protein
MMEIRFDKTKDEVALLIWFLVDHSVQLKYSCILETINDIFVFILYLVLLKMLCIIIICIKKYFLFLWKLLRKQQRIIQLNIADTSTQYRY